MKETRIKKIVVIGCSLGVTIPPDVMKSLKLEKGEEIRVTYEKIKEEK